jgi:predicted glycoside hydrolase/deacetylase ChbG (UPF0249 family)/glycosyltransferase involved in cell wall biosynthesis
MEQTMHIACPPRRLIINADDLGLCPERDAGILQLHACGAITSASLLVQGENAKAAAAAAIAAGLPLGLHLNLSEGRPTASSDRNSLTDSDGGLRGKFGLRAALAAGVVPADDLAREIRAQFDAFIALTGELPSHVDGHHHIHVEAPVAAVLAPIMAREYGVYCLRLPRERTLPAASDTDYDADFQHAVVRAADNASPVFAEQGIYSTTAFLGQSFMGYRLQAASIAAALAELDRQHAPTPAKPLWLELMVHPGIPAADSTRGEFCRSPARAHEMTVLQSEDWRAATANWEAASFRELPRPLADARQPSRPSILIYGKLTPATGNAETARRYAAAWSELAEVRFRPAPADIESPPALAREAQRLQELAARERLDLAFGIHLYRAGKPLTAAFGTRADAVPLPFGLLASGTDANADIDIPAHRTAIDTALAQADFLLCLSDAQMTRLSPNHLPEDSLVLGNGIDVSTSSCYSLRAALRLDDDAALILFPASLRRLKGVLPLIEALAETLATDFPKHVLVVLGPALEPAYAEAIHARIAGLLAEYPVLKGRIVLHAGLAHADYLAALREAALVLNASEHEGLSHGLMEAMAAGIPVLARNIPGNRQLVRDGENGRLFDSFAELPAAYASCFTEPARTARMIVQARADIACRYSAEQESAGLRTVLARCLTRRQAALSLTHGGPLHLDLATGTHPMSPENVELFRHLALSPAAEARWPETLDLAVDVGCGCGVFGLLLLDALAAGNRRLHHLRFTDTHAPSLAALSRTLIRHRQQLPMLATASLANGSLLAPLLQTGQKAQIVCANLPQTPGPAALSSSRPDRCGGSDGAELICALIAQLPAVLTEDGEAFMLHISLAHPARVARTLAAHGLTATVLAEQARRACMADYAAMLPELPAYLLDEHAAGRAEFSLQGDAIDAIEYHARLLRISRCR